MRRFPEACDGVLLRDSRPGFGSMPGRETLDRLALHPDRLLITDYRILITSFAGKERPAIRSIAYCCFKHKHWCITVIGFEPPMVPLVW